MKHHFPGTGECEGKIGEESAREENLIILFMNTHRSQDTPNCTYLGLYNKSFEKKMKYKSPSREGKTKLTI